MLPAQYDDDDVYVVPTFHSLKSFVSIYVKSCNSILFKITAI